MNIMELHKPIYKKANIAAFSNRMSCPHPNLNGRCGAEKWKFVEQISPFRIRYRCRVCGRTIQYDFSNNPTSINKVYGKNTEQIIRNVLWKFKNLLTRKPV